MDNEVDTAPLVTVVCSWVDGWYHGNDLCHYSWPLVRILRLMRRQHFLARPETAAAAIQKLGFVITLMRLRQLAQQVGESSIITDMVHRPCHWDGAYPIVYLPVVPRWWGFGINLRFYLKLCLFWLQSMQDARFVVFGCKIPLASWCHRYVALNQSRRAFACDLDCSRRFRVSLSTKASLIRFGALTHCGRCLAPATNFWQPWH